MILKVRDWLDEFVDFARLPAPLVIEPFHRPAAPLRQLLRRIMLIAGCIFIGIFYGFFYTVFPPFLLVYLAIPLVILVFVVIWALPDQRSAPVGALEWLYFAFALTLVLWPSYLAFAFPGLPWISFRRLIGFPMGLVLLVCASSSPQFRREMIASLAELPALWKMMAAFTAYQFLTVFISKHPFMSLNLFINNLFLLIAPFFIGAWLFTKPGRIEKFAYFLVGMATVLGVMGIAENYQQQILWAQHIPPFLKIEDEAVQKILTSNFRDGEYRVTGTYSVSLALGEYLALVVPFVLHWLLLERRLKMKILWAGLDLFLLTIIVLTRARLGITGFIVAHAFYGSVWVYRRWRANRLDLLGPAMAIAYPILGALFVFGMFFVDAIKFRTIGGGSTGFSDDARQVQWEMAKPLIAKNPFGYGIGQGGGTLGFMTPGGQLTIDSYVLAILMDAGIIGFLLFFGIILYAAFAACKVGLRHSRGELGLALPVAAALVTFAVIKIVFAGDDNHPLIFMILGLAAALPLRARLDESGGIKPSASPRNVQRPASARR